MNTFYRKVSVTEGLPKEENDIIKFLSGEQPFDGVWFGDKHPTKEGKFWWRDYLPIEVTLTSEQLEKMALEKFPVEMVQMPDCKIDHNEPTRFLYLQGLQDILKLITNE